MAEPELWVERFLAGEPPPLAHPPEAPSSPQTLAIRRSNGWPADAVVRVALWQAVEHRAMVLRGHPDALSLPEDMGRGACLAGVVWEGERPILHWFGAKVVRVGDDRFEVQPLIDADRALTIRVIDANTKAPIPGAELRRLSRSSSESPGARGLPPWSDLASGPIWVADEAGQILIDAAERERLLQGLLAAAGYEARVVSGLAGSGAPTEVELDAGASLLVSIAGRNMWPKGYALHVGRLDERRAMYPPIIASERAQVSGPGPWPFHGLQPGQYELSLAPREYGDLLSPFSFQLGMSPFAQLPELEWTLTNSNPAGAADGASGRDPKELLRRLRAMNPRVELPAEPLVEEETEAVTQEGDTDPMDGRGESSSAREPARDPVRSIAPGVYESGAVPQGALGARRRVRLEAGEVQAVAWRGAEVPPVRDLEIRVMAPPAWGLPKAGPALFLKQRAVIAQRSISWQSRDEGGFEGLVRFEQTAAVPDQLWLPAQTAVLDLQPGQSSEIVNLPEPARFEVELLDSRGEPRVTRIAVCHLREGVAHPKRPMYRPMASEMALALRTDSAGRASWLAPAQPAIVLLGAKGELQKKVLVLPGVMTRIGRGNAPGAIVLAMGPPGVPLPVGLRVEITDEAGGKRSWAIEREGELEFVLSGIEPAPHAIEISAPSGAGGTTKLLDARIRLSSGRAYLLSLDRLIPQRL